MEQLILPGYAPYIRSVDTSSDTERDRDALRFANEWMQYALPGLERDLAALKRMKEVSEHTMQLQFSYGRAPL